MALDLFCYSSLELAKVQEILTAVKIKHVELFAHKFLISDGRETTEVGKEIALEHGMHAQCLFLIRLNDKEVSYRYHEAVVIIKEALGDANVVILFEGETRQ